MSADWIKMRVDLYRDPKVCVIADHLMDQEGALARYVSQVCQRDMTVTRNVTRNVTVGALVTVWGVMRHRGKRNGDSLFCKNISLSVIDDVADLPGFGDAMASVGWAIQTPEGVEFPAFFEEYNVDPAEKKPGSAAERQRRYRERIKEKSDAKGDAQRDVTRDVTVTPREEKRREEKKEQKAATVVAMPSADDFRAEMWRRWKALDDGGGGAYLSKLMKSHPEELVLQAVERTLDHEPADPKAFIVACIRTLQKGKQADDDIFATAI